MQIIIVGCGKVGATLVEQLSGENHNIVVIDEKEEKIHAITDEYDAMGIIGNGVSYQTLLEAGIAKADLLIAVTGSDEQNLLSCVIAKKTGNCKAIARIQNPIYHAETTFLRDVLGIAMITNPDFSSAADIARVFQFPSAVKIDTFAKGRTEMIHFRIPKDSVLDNFPLYQLRREFKCDVLVCMVTRGEEVIIPRGDFVFQGGDVVAIVSTPANATHFFKKIGINTGRVRTAMLIGGGKIAYYLAKRLLSSGVQTKIIEINPARCEKLSELLPEATIICGDGTNQKLLMQENIASVDGFAALTGLDEENILLSLFAKKVSGAKVVTKIDHINFSSVLSDLNMDSICYPRLLTAESIIKYARSMNASLHTNVENLYKLQDGRAEALEFYIKSPEANITSIPLQNMHLKKNILICSIVRGGKVLIPAGQDMLMPGDSVVIVAGGHHISDLKEIIED